MENSKIEWCTHTANLWIGCVEVHEGCDNCYARVLNNRWKQDNWGNNVPRREVKSVWSNLDKYQRLAAEAGRIDSVFVGSMMDIFEKPMPVVDSNGNPSLNADTGVLRNDLFNYISKGQYPNLLFLLLTKRPSNINKYIPESWKKDPPTNVVFGTSPVNQATGNKLIPQLLEVKGRKFLSCEPMLGPIKLDALIREESGYAYVDDCLTGFKAHGAGGWFGEKIDWVICGGESGHHKRPFHTDWAYSLRDQCQAAGVPFFMKQIDKVQPIPEDLLIRQFPVIN